MIDTQWIAENLKRATSHQTWLASNRRRRAELAGVPALTISDLRRRGWKRERIDALGEPDYVCFAKYGTHSPRYLLSRIEAVERYAAELVSSYKPDLTLCQVV